jgi:hypothetical protein
MAMIRSLALAALLALSAGCDIGYDGTFVVDELSILGVQMQPSELVFDIDELLLLPAGHFPTTHLYMSALAVNPEELGGQDAILHCQWSIGDPPLEGTMPIVTSDTELRFEGDSLFGALEMLVGGSEQLTPAALASLLSDGDVQLPIVVTAVTADDTATAVKLLTIRGERGWAEEANDNPHAEGLEIGSAPPYPESLLVALGNQPLTAPAVGRDAEVEITVDPDDDAKDGDVASTMYSTAGHIYWSAESMRTWNLTTPDEDYGAPSFRVFIVLRDLEGAQSWITIAQPLLY